MFSVRQVERILIPCTPLCGGLILLYMRGSRNPTCMFQNFILSIALWIDAHCHFAADFLIFFSFLLRFFSWFLHFLFISFAFFLPQPPSDTLSWSSFSFLFLLLLRHHLSLILFLLSFLFFFLLFPLDRHHHRRRLLILIFFFAIQPAQQKKSTIFFEIFLTLIVLLMFEDCYSYCCFSKQI